MLGGGMLGLAACFAMTTSGLCCLMPMAHQHMAMPGHHQDPQPDQPMGCHAALGCAAHRKLKRPGEPAA